MGTSGKYLRCKQGHGMTIPPRVFSCDGISDHAKWNGNFHYWDTKLSCRVIDPKNKVNEQTWRLAVTATVEQENFATGNFREFRPQAIRVQEIFANFLIAEVLAESLGPLLYFGNIRVHEIFANLAKIAKISCLRKFAVLQYSKWDTRYGKWSLKITHSVEHGPSTFPLTAV